MRRAWRVLLPALVIVALAVLTPVAALAALLEPTPGRGAHAGVSDAYPRIQDSKPARPVSITIKRGTHKPPAILGVPPVGPASATFSVTYNGFTPQAQAAFQAAVDVWAARINSTQVIHINANWVALAPEKGGSAGSNNLFRLTGDPNYYSAALAEAKCHCEIPNQTYEINANFNSARTDWYFGTDGATPVDKADLETVVLHEIGHGLGFLSTYSVASGIGSWGGGGASALLTVYDSYTMSAASGGFALNDTGSVANDSAALATQLTDGGVWFAGPATMAANGGARARLYAPATWIQGSSISHFDEATYPTGTANALMTPSLSTGEVNHVTSPLTLAVLQDTGWSTNPVDGTPPTFPDSVVPTGGTTTSVSNPAVVAWTWDAASDAGVGLPPSPYQVRVDPASASLGVCGTFAIGTPVSVSTLIYTKPSPVDGTCYRAVVTASDRNGNTTSHTSGNFIYDTSAPVATVTLGESVASMSVTGTTLYLATPTAGQTFTATYTVTDASAIGGYTCPTVAGFNATKSGTGPYVCTYTATGAGYAGTTATATFSDSAQLTANTGNAQSFSVVRDITAPVVTFTWFSAGPGTSIVASDAIAVATPAAGTTIVGRYSITEAGSGVASLTCPGISGFTVARTGASPLFTCTWTATGSGYSNSLFQVTVADAVGNLGGSNTGAVNRDITAPTATVAISESSAGLFAPSTTSLFVGTPSAGATFTGTYTITESGSGLAGFTCPAVAGFSVAKTGTPLQPTCTWTATGSGYAAGTPTADLVDNVGNASTVPFTVTRDATAPTATVAIAETVPTMVGSGASIALGVPVNGQQFTATYTLTETGSGLNSFTCPALAGFSVAASGAGPFVCTFTALGSGYASATPTATFSDRVDNGGSTLFSVTLDQTAPAVTFATPGSTTTGSKATSFNVAWTETETGSGVASRSLQRQAGAVVTAGTCAGVSWANDGAPDTGSSPRLNTGLVSGKCYRWIATVTDNLNNVSPVTSGAVLVDTVAPVVAFSAPDPAGATVVTNAAGVNVAWTESDPLTGISGRSLQRQAATVITPGSCAGVSFAADGAADTSATSPQTINGLTDGRCYRWTQTITDGALNSTPATSGVVLLDRTAPTATVALDEGSATLAVSGTELFVGAPPAGQQFTATFTITEAGSGLAPFTCPSVTGFNAGKTGSNPIVCTYTATGSGYAAGTPSATLLDNAGNSGAAGFTVTLDVVAPDLSFSVPTGAWTPQSATSVDVTWDETEAGSGIGSRSLQRQSAAPVHVGDCDGVTWAADGAAVAGGSPKTSGSLVDGTCYRWAQTLTDKVGNTATVVSGPVQVDTTAPGVTVTPSSAAAHISVVGSTVTVTTPTAGEVLKAQVDLVESGSGFAGVTCPDLAGFTKDKSGSFPTVTCTWTATGSGYAPATVTIHATDAAGNDASGSFTVATVLPVPTLDPLPAGWTGTDIGAVGTAGTSGIVHDTGQFYSAGAGKGFSRSSDAFRFVYQAMRGDGTFAMRLASSASPSPKGVVGVMIREGTTGTGRFVFIGRRSNGSIDIIKRTAKGKAAVTTTVRGVAAGTPVQLRIVRKGNVFALQYKTGAAWKSGASITLALSGATKAGVATTSRTTAATAASTWDNVVFLP
ncbi:MAG: hypothetical protein U0869_02965 [Chloroflexota bacterium]